MTHTITNAYGTFVERTAADAVVGDTLASGKRVTHVGQASSGQIGITVEGGVRQHHFRPADPLYIKVPDAPTVPTVTTLDVVNDHIVQVEGWLNLITRAWQDGLKPESLRLLRVYLEDAVADMVDTMCGDND